MTRLLAPPIHEHMAVFSAIAPESGPVRLKLFQRLTFDARQQSADEQSGLAHLDDDERVRSWSTAAVARLAMNE